MYAVLGDVQFELITYFDGMEAQFGVEYAEHPVIGGKPRLQWVGDKLDEFSLDLTFHMSYCDPEAELLKLREAMLARQARQFVLGNGAYKGWFVITDVKATSRQTDKAGGLIALDANVTLREYVEPKTLETRKAQSKKAAADTRAAAPQKTVADVAGATVLPPVAMPKPPSLMSSLAGAVAQAKEAAQGLITSALASVGGSMGGVMELANSARESLVELDRAIALPGIMVRDVIGPTRAAADMLRSAGLSGIANAAGVPDVLSTARNAVSAATVLSRATTVQGFLSGGGTRG